MTKVPSSNNATAAHCRGSNIGIATQNAASSLCEEMVTLWRLGALNPKLSPYQRKDMLSKFRDWHISTIEKVRKARSNTSNPPKKGEVETFPGFKPAVEACALTWEDYPIPGVTYSEKDGSRFFYHFGSNKPHDSDAKKPSRVQPVTVCSQDIIISDNPNRVLNHVQRAQYMVGAGGSGHSRTGDVRQSTPSRRDSGHDGAMSSGSEGFCEPERGCRDSDSSGDSKGMFSRSNSLEEVEPLQGGAITSSKTTSSSLPQDLSCIISGTSKLSMSGRRASLNSNVFDETLHLDLTPNVNPKKDQRENVSSLLRACSFPPESQSGAFAAAPALSCSSSSSSSTATSSLHGFKEPQPEQSDLSANPQPSAQANQSESNEVHQQQRGDEYQIYFYDTKAKSVDNAEKKKKDKTEEPNMFAGLRSVEHMQDVSFKNIFKYSLKISSDQILLESRIICLA